ncbi:MAG: CDP-glycerol glycerophosphotransferase family protein [Eubacterium sp.]|nr:CDP-glycerol glycerophosphotransferase family protein [Eubacterium sp.]
MILYIDPGTGSMLFTILLGVLGAAFYFLRNFFMKFKMWISGGKDAGGDSDKQDIVIFSDHKRYWNVFEPICDEFEKRGQKVIFMTASEDDPALSKKYENIECMYIGEGNKAFAKLNNLNAKVVLSTTPSLDVFQWKRSRDVEYYIHIPHASSDIILYRMFGIDYYDAILLSGKYQIKQIRDIEKLRNLPEKELEIVGIPYMDEMKKRLDKELAAKKESGSSEKKKPTVLLAPSWGKSGILSKYGAKFIELLIDTGYNIIVRPHPQSYTSEKDMMDELMSKFPENDNFKWDRESDNFNSLMNSDILISDFSGVIFDYTLVFNKPVIYTDTEFDKSPYDACWVDDELWTFKILPEIGQVLNEDNFEDIKTIIDNTISSEKFSKGREQARNETWCHMGEGTVRTVDYVMKKLETLNEKVEDAELQLN